MKISGVGNSQAQHKFKRGTAYRKVRPTAHEYRSFRCYCVLPMKVLDFVKSGGPKGMVGGTIFEMWLGAL